MDDKLQDDALMKADRADHERLVTERGPYETLWRQIDDRFPSGAGGFNQQTPGQVRGANNFDTTHVTSLKRFAAAGVAITTPTNTQYIRPRFSDELMKIRAVKLWCEEAGKRLFAIRHANGSNFSVSANEDWDQLGRYGTSVMWNDAVEGYGLFYKTLHLSECFIDENFAGQTDTIHRKMRKSARQLEQLLGRDALTSKMIEALDKDKPHTEFEILHIVAPNTQYDRERLDWRRMPVASRYIALDEKVYLRRSGYHTSPMSCSRHLTSAGEKYGRSPATELLPTISGVNAMRHTILRAGHKMVDPALVYFDDDGITSVSTKPGGLTGGLVNERGQVLIGRMPGGEQGIPYAMEMVDQERDVIRTEFLEEFYKILTNPNSRMTTTEVLEVMAKQGVLVQPYAGRYRTEKQQPVTSRDLDLALRHGQIAPFPPEVREAGEWPEIDYENPMAAMARAEATGKTMRFVEAITPFAQFDEGRALDWVDADAIVPGMADEIGVDPKYIRDAKAVAKLRAKRDEDKAAAADMEAMQGASDAYLNVAKANSLSEAA